MPARRTTAVPSVHQLKVTLLGTKPPVWRRLLVPSDLTLAGLHPVLQVAMGWDGCHLYEFSVGGVAYGDPNNDDDGWGGITGDHLVTLGQVAGPGGRFSYLYDFGDNWEHRIVVEKVRVDAIAAPTVTCVGGRRACPPEDCGGVWGYEEMLAVLADPDHPDRPELFEWAGELDPEDFDREAVNATLSGMFAERGRRRVAGSARR